MGNRILYIFLIYSLTISQLLSQDLSFAFLEDTVCIEENVEYSFSDSGVDNVYFDFCNGEFDAEPLTSSLASISGLSLSRGLEIIKFGQNYYGLVTNNVSDKIYLLEFGIDLLSVPEINEVNLNGDVLDGPSDVEFFLSGDSLVAYIGTSVTGFGVTRLDFGTQISPNAFSTNLGNFGFNSQQRDIKMIIQDENVYLLVLNLDLKNIARVRYDNGDLNDIPVITNTNSYTQLTNPAGLEIINVGSDLLGFISSLDSHLILRLNFQNDITSEPIEEIEYSFPEFNRPAGLDIIRNGDGYFGIISNLSTSITLIDFKDLNLLSEPEVIDYSLGTSNDIIFNSYQGQIYSFYTQGSSLKRVDFESDCNASIKYANGIPENDLYFSNSDTIKAIITGEKDNSLLTEIDTLVVKNSAIPDLDINFNDNRCVNSQIGFYAINQGGGVDEYNWDFGDGVGTSSLQNPEYQYSTDNDFLVTLSAMTEAGCKNEVDSLITIYREPNTPKFQVVTSDLCSNSEVLFENQTDSIGLEEIIKYEWDFNSQGFSSSLNPSFIFPDAGIKNVSLLAYIPGCTTSVYTEPISIEKGPNVQFSYTNNCYELPIQFINETDTSGIISWNWEFGDGTGVSNQYDTVYQYLSTGEYTVSLSALNNLGCTTTYNKDINVSNNSLIDFTNDNPIENLPSVFEAIDLTQDDDSVLTWNWNFEDLLISNERLIEIVFPFPQEYYVSLDVVTAQGCQDTIIKNIEVLEALFPTPIFELDSSYCIGEEILIRNDSKNSVSFEWDFCGNEFQNAPEIENLSNFDLNQVRGIELIQDGDTQIGFFADRINGTLYRIDFAKDFLEIDSIVNLGITLESPEGIKGIVQSDSLYLFIGSGTTGKGITRLDFHQNFKGIPIVKEMGNFGIMSQFRDIELYSENDSIYLFTVALNTKEIIRANLGLTLAEEVKPVSIDLSPPFDQLVNPSGIEHVVTDSGEYLIFITSIDGDHLLSRFSLGNFIYGDFIHQSDYNISVFDRPNKIEIFETPTGSYGLITNLNTSTVLLDFGDISNDDEPTVVSSELPIFQDITGIKFNGKYFIYGWEEDVFNRLSYDSECGSNIKYSTQINPQLEYSQKGTHNIQLIVTGDNGRKRVLNKEIIIEEKSSPVFSFQSSPNLCLTNPTTFTADITSGNVETFSWDLDNDGLEDSDSSFVEFQYDSAATYPIRLDVIADNGCSNFVLDTITLYPEPPITDFLIDATTNCVDVEHALVNLTDESGYDDILQYQWYLDGDSLSAASDTVYAFTVNGEYIIGLQSSIPGCASDITYDTLTVNPLPLVDFNASLACIGEETYFTNLSDPASYQWSFGDGFGSTLEGPSHLYNDPGTYTASLIATDANGCIDTLTQSVKVGAIPEVDYSYDLACSQTSTQFISEVLVPNANVANYTWQVDGETVANNESPELTLSQDAEVRLIVESTDGCEAEFLQSIIINELPEPQFTIETACEGEEYLLVNQTEDIMGLEWMVNGEIYTGDTVRILPQELDTLEATLWVQGNNLCDADLTQSVPVLKAPQVDFSSLEEACVGDRLTLSDQTLVQNDPVIRRTWFSEGNELGSGTTAVVSFEDPGTYTVTLQTETENGCTYTREKNITIYALPETSFTASSDFGVVDDVITFENTSESDSVFWVITGDTLSTDPVLTYPFTRPGNFMVQLFSVNENGCVGGASFPVLIDRPRMDIVVNNFELIENDNGLASVAIHVTNLGNLPVELLEVTLTLEDRFSLNETIRSRIDQQQEGTFQLNTQIPLVAGTPGYVCVTVNNPYGTEDLDPSNNERCVTLEPKVVFEPSYPNPAERELKIPVILPDEGDVRITLIALSGQVKLSTKFDTIERGLTTFLLDLEDIDAGIYFLKIEAGGKVSTERIAVR